MRFWFGGLIISILLVALTDKEKANGGQSNETDADQYFEPLEMACQTRQPRLMEIALNAIHFLVGMEKYLSIVCFLQIADKYCSTSNIFLCFCTTF